MNRPKHSTWLAICLFVFAASAEAAEVVSPNTGLPPELQATDLHSLFGMVSTGSPEATEAAAAVLERGGNAVDAAVAAAFTLGVSEPGGSGLGGLTYVRIADGGADTFYRGTMADQINADMEANGGYLRKVDLARYRVTETAPLRSRYRDAEIMAFPPPGGGGEVVETLNILETFPSAFIAEHSPERLHVMIEATRLSQADQSGTSAGAGPLFGASNLDEAHARELAALIAPGQAIPETQLGPRGAASVLGEHTTQVSVVDRDGNVVSLTQTLCRQYGSKVAAPGLGFVYNSCLEFLDFENPQSLIYLCPGGTFPTDMAPTIVRTPDQVIALGSAGSDRIPPSICEVITNIVDRHLDIRDAVVVPRVIWNSAHDPSRLCIEVAPPIGQSDVKRMRRMGFDTMYVLRYPPDPMSDAAFFGGVNAAAFDSSTGVFTGVGDPRRDGFAAGPRVAASSREQQ